MVVLVPNGIASKEVAVASLDKAWKEVLLGLQEQGIGNEAQVQEVVA